MMELRSQWVTPLAVFVAALVGAFTATQTGVNLSLATRAVAALPAGSAPDVPAAACVSFMGVTDASLGDALVIDWEKIRKAIREHHAYHRMWPPHVSWW